MFKWIKTETAKKKTTTVQKFKPVFTTVDGKMHTGLEYNYGITSRLRCSIPEYLMIDIKNDGYIKDCNNVMYLLGNVISIDWQLIDEKEIKDRFNTYTVFVSTEEVKQYELD